MNDELCSGGNLIEKSAAVKRGTRSGLLIHKGGELFPKKIRLTENEILEKKLAEAQGYVEKERERRKSELPFVHSPLVEKEGTSEGAKAGWETRRGGGGGKEVPGSFAEVALAERIRAGISPDERAWAKRALAAMSRPGSPRQQARAFAETLPKPTTEKTGMVVAGQISKDMVEKIMRDGGWDKLPLTDKAREIVEDAISRGAKPATEYTGKLMVEHAIPEEPPAFTRPQRIKVGDTVIPLSWVGVCLQGAKFDLPSVPEAARVKKMYTGPAKVTKESFPYGKFPRDLSKVETVVEDRLWALELEPVGIKKDGDDSYFLPVTTRDTTLVLRLDPQATPSGEVNPGVSQRD